MKILASDYDGTLNRQGIPDYVRDALARWRELGNRFGIVSGRGIYNISATIRRDGVICDFFVANNGAVIADGEGRVLISHTGDAEKAAPIASFIIERGGAFACLNDLVGDHFICSDEEKRGRYASDARFTGLSDFSGGIAFTQISTVCSGERAAEELTGALNAAFGDAVSAFQNGICIDIVPAGVDKAKGIEELLALYGASHGDVCTVGDNNNDIAMLAAFRSYAVENAIPKVKEIAGAVVTDLAALVEKELSL